MTDPSTLGGVYAEFVRDPEHNIDPLIAQLSRSEWWVESDWLKRFAEGIDRALVTQPFSRHLGRRLWIGRELPVEAAAGDIWFDVLEVMPMILLPSEPLGWREEHPLITYPALKSWLACRPVATWQYQGYCLLSGQSLPPSTAEQSTDTGWIGGVTRGESRGYAKYMGKGLSGHSDWQAAIELVSSHTLDEMWAERAGEWSGERSDYDEDLAFVVTSDTFHVDLDDALDAHDLEDAPDPRGITVFDPDSRLPNVGFRTSVNLQIGLMDRPQPAS